GRLSRDSKRALRRKTQDERGDAPPGTETERGNADAPSTQWLVADIRVRDRQHGTVCNAKGSGTHCAPEPFALPLTSSVFRLPSAIPAELLLHPPRRVRREDEHQHVDDGADDEHRDRQADQAEEDAKQSAQDAEDEL